VDFIGVKTKMSYYSSNHIESTRVECNYPDFDEEYFEWVDVLESVQAAGNSYTMVELGAGWGRWLSRAYKALKQMYPEKSYQLIGVEAEPTHFKWLVEHCTYNQIESPILIEAAVDVSEGEVGFYTGQPAEWYGQCIGGETLVKAISLRSLLLKYPSIDLMDIDIQGQEYKVLYSAKDLLNRVKRFHIGTHSVEVEDSLRGLFKEMGWKCLRDFTLNTEHGTEYGRAKFNDGVQTWVSG
jgi:FkbM family methyltransferase